MRMMCIYETALIALSIPAMIIRLFLYIHNQINHRNFRMVECVLVKKIFVMKTFTKLETPPAHQPRSPRQLLMVDFSASNATHWTVIVTQLTWGRLLIVISTKDA